MKRNWILLLTLFICLNFFMGCRGVDVHPTEVPLVNRDRKKTAHTSKEDAEKTLPTSPERNTHTPSPHIEVPIWIREGHIEPKLIELYVGQDVVLDIYHRGVKNHSFTIGRDVIWEDGRPIGFETGFIETLPSPMYGGSIITLPIDRIVDPSIIKRAEGMGWLEGQPLSYEKTIFLMYRPWWKFEWKDHFILGPDFSIYSHASIEDFSITQSLIGEWEFACFSEHGQHYLDGEHGKIIIKQP